MKKLLTFTFAITIALSGMAQHGKQKGHQKYQEKNHKNKSYKSDRDENNNSGNWQTNDSKYSKNLPAKVRSSFNRDYPNATNVTWTKSNGNWMASFPTGYYRGTAIYAANGQRINSTNNSTSNNTRRRTQSQNADGSVWNRILTNGQ